MSRPDMGLRRMGIQLASQLPDSLEDALLVLEYAKQVIEHVHGGGDGGSLEQQLRETRSCLRRRRSLS